MRKPSSLRDLGGAMVYLLLLPINLLQLLFVLSWTAGWITIALLVLLLTRSTYIPLGLSRWVWAPGILAIGPWRVEVEGGEGLDWTRPYFFAANHQSFLDIPVLFRALPLPLHFVVKDELRKAPFLGWYVAAMGMIFVDRANPERAARSVKRAASAVRSGKAMMIFPEGTRSADGRLRRFKSGGFAAAIDAGIPVVPIAIDGTLRAFPPAGAFKIRWSRLRVRIGAPIESAELDHDRHCLAVRTHDEVALLLEGLRAP
jgi:1-acyl-sn-glycerol-3-phosphate acyltransferase